MSMFRRQTDVSSTSESDDGSEYESESGSERGSSGGAEQGGQVDNNDTHTRRSPPGHGQGDASKQQLGSSNRNRTRTRTRTRVLLHRARTIDSEEDTGASRQGNDNNSHSSLSQTHSHAGTDGTDDDDHVAASSPSHRDGGGAPSTEILFTNGELSSTGGGGFGSSDGTSTAAHRDIMMAGLLEHYYHSRALDFLVAANPGVGYHRESSEVKQLGAQLLAQATQRLAAGGVLDAATFTGDNAEMRRQYLLGLDSLALPGVNVETLQSDDGSSAAALVAEGQQQGARTRRRRGLVSSVHDEVDDDDDESSDLGGQHVVFARPNNSNNNNADIKDLVIPMRVMDMGMGMRLPYVPHPANDLQLSLRQPPVPPQRASHYKTSFEEISFLGKGGFGSVFKCWNRFDDRMYAVKKIPLSPRLSKSFCEGGHDRLGKLLREVRALATFDHSNIVRYHATWIEEPSHSATENAGRARTTRVGYAPPLAAQMRAGNPRRQPKLLEHHPLHTASDSEPSFSDSPQQHEVSAGNDIVFGFDTNSGQPSAAGHSSLAGPPGPQWSEQPGSTNRIEELSSSEGQDDSDIFTDGDRLGASARDIVPTGITVPDPTVHVLHIQMSLYPMTLAQYLSPTRPPTHCFHLIPSLRLLLSILTGLQYIHSKGLIHRDIKPGNIFLSPASPSTTESSHSGYCNVGDCDSCHAANTSSSGTPPTTSSSPTSSSATNKSSPIWLNPRIGDFGLVTQLAREGLSSSSPDSLEQSLSGVFGSEVSSDKDEHLVGTMYYRPPRWPPSSQPSSPGRRRPEQPPQPPQPQQQPTRKSAKPRNLDEKLDIFALGVVLVEMLACCHTAMQRVDMLKAIQDGRIPAEDIRRCCAVRDHHLRHQEQQKRQLEQQVVVENGIADQVVALVEGMLALDPDERWNGSRVRAAVEKILIEYKASKDVVD